MCSVRHFPGNFLCGKQYVCLSSLFRLFTFLAESWEDLIHLPLREFRVINILANTRNISKKTNISFRTNSFSKRTYLTTSESDSVTGGLRSDCRKWLCHSPRITAGRGPGLGCRGWTVFRQHVPGWNIEAAGLGAGREWLCIWICVCICLHTHTRKMLSSPTCAGSFVETLWFSWLAEGWESRNQVLYLGLLTWCLQNL